MIFPNENIADFLNIIIVATPFLFLNLWSIVHLISGFILGKFFGKEYLFIFGLLFLYEFFEIMMVGVWFRPETLLDIIWDLLIGMLGVFAYNFIFN